MHVLMISGFLGAGKTTLIKYLAEHSGRTFAVLENEYGEVGVDGDDLKDKNLEVLELVEGCICCTRKGNFTGSLLALQGTLNPDFLVVEPSGVGLLGTILSTLAPLAKTGIYTLAPVTVVDAAAWARGLDQFGPYYEDQIRHAGTLVLTKTDGLPEGVSDRLVEWLKELNPRADLVADDYRLRGRDWAASLFDRPLEGAPRPSVTLSLAEFRQVTFTELGLKRAGDCVALLERIAAGEFGSVARVKGFAPFEEGQWGHFDYASGRWGLEPCESMPPSRAVVIGTELDLPALKAAFAAENCHQDRE